MKAPALFILLVPACSAPSFDAPSLVESVRVLATRADLPYAPPGTVVSLETLAVDGRPEADPATPPMHVYFLPKPCINPPGDAYYGCFPDFAKQFSAGVELGPKLNQGDTFKFRMPDDVIDLHVGSPEQARYGLAVLFTIACAGRAEYRPDLAGGSPDGVPFGCFDAAGVRVSARDFVFAYALIYAFADRANSNPAFSSLSYGGRAIDPEQGLDLAHCEKKTIDDCPATPLDLDLPSSSQELDPGNLTANGDVLGETLYVQYFSTAGKIAHDTVVLFDPRAGRLAHTANDFRAPLARGEYRLWAILRDNRGGASWQQFPIHVH